MDTEQIRAWLDQAWNDALVSGSNAPDEEVDRLINSSVGSIRCAA